MKTTLKIALLASVLMATPVLAGSATQNTTTKHHSQRATAKASLDEADRMNGSNSRTSYDRSTDNRWLGMNATTRGMKDGVDSDMNNRSQHSFIFGNGGNRVVKH